MTTTPNYTVTELVPTAEDLGANKVTFTGDRTTITFFPQTPGPVVRGHEGGELIYDGPEGTFTRFGADIQRLDSPLGFVLTLVLRPNNDTGQIDVNILLPRIVDLTREAPVTFATVAIKTTSRGFIARPGAALSYDVLPLSATAEISILPL
jgi:hypothetical protein